LFSCGSLLSFEVHQVEVLRDDANSVVGTGAAQTVHAIARAKVMTTIEDRVAYGERFARGRDRSRRIGRHASRPFRAGADPVA
jgi:peptidyl-tRNA hydrolase